MKRITKTPLIIVLIIIMSCRSNNIIPKKDMVPILVKIYLTDATVMNSDYSIRFFQKDSIDYYSSIIKSFGYTPVQFDSSLRYYNRKPDDLDAIYDKVIFELSKLDKELDQPKIVVQDSVEISDAKNIWNLKPNYELNLIDLQDLIIFMVPVEGLGTYTISYEIQVFSDDESITPGLKAYFYYDDKSPEGYSCELQTIPYIKDGAKREIKAVFKLENNLITHLTGYILDYFNTDKNFRNHVKVSNIKLLYEPFIKPKKVKRIDKNSLVE